MTSEERLAEQLDKKDEEIGTLEAKVEQLEREIESSSDGWRRSVDLIDNPELPLPRLELAYEKRPDWSCYRVHYRLVMRHLLGEVYTLPISHTRCDGGSSTQKAPADLPFRDGSHAAHDAAFMRLPCYKIMPDREPELIDFSDYITQQRNGVLHRRLVDAAKAEG